MLGILLGALFAFLFVAFLLVLLLGARSIEDQLAERAGKTREIHARAVRVPRFLVVNRAPAAQGWIDPMLLSRVQQYLEAEQMLAEEFVLQPSIESLYRDSGRSITGH
jgi:hypothetical protein